MILSNSDLTDAIFEQTNLNKADLSQANNYNIDPDNNNIKKTKFSKFGLQGLLAKYDIDIV